MAQGSDETENGKASRGDARAKVERALAAWEAQHGPLPNRAATRAEKVAVLEAFGLDASVEPWESDRRAVLRIVQEAERGSMTARLRLRELARVARGEAEARVAVTNTTPLVLAQLARLLTFARDFNPARIDPANNIVRFEVSRRLRVLVKLDERYAGVTAETVCEKLTEARAKRWGPDRLGEEIDAVAGIITEPKGPLGHSKVSAATLRKRRERARKKAKQAKK